MAGAGKKPHALVVPAPGQGHVNPCMLLARSLASLGFRIGFVYFSSDYVKLKSRQHLMQEEGAPTCPTPLAARHPEPDPGFIHIHVVEDGRVPGAPADMLGQFFATPSMEENLFNLTLQLQEQGAPLTCLIADTFAPWTLHVAKRAGIPLINFWASNAMAYLLIHGLSALFAQGIFPETGCRTQWKRETPLMLGHIPCIPPFPSEMYPAAIRFADSSNPFVGFLNEVASFGQQGKRILIHSLLEIEPDAFHALQELGIPAYAVGSLLHETEKQEGSISSSELKENTGHLQVSELDAKLDYMAWLNTQAESSVMYIAFGSQASISVEDIQELAEGLEASGSPFLWVIREDVLGGAELCRVLPSGFLDRNRGKGMIISWASQVEVLAHKASGGFLSHCGWNSTLESLWEGVPMLCCASGADQTSNSHYICNVWGTGLELARTRTGGIERRQVEEGVKRLMQQEEGLTARRKAQEVMELVRTTGQQGGQSFRNLQKFYEDMEQLSVKTASE